MTGGAAFTSGASAPEAKVYLVRHQAAGLLHEFPFACHPSGEQLAALAKLCFQLHGAQHPRTREPYWLRVEELSLLGGDFVPDVPDRSLSVAQSAGAPRFEVSGTGHVTPPKGK